MLNEIILNDLLKSFITLFVIMDPFGSLPIFVGLTKGLSNKETIRNSNNAVLVAGALLYIFLFFGSYIFQFFNISIEGFMIAGGIILLVIGILHVLGIQQLNNKKDNSKDVASVPIGTPLLTGPGVITSTIILVKTYGIAITFISGTITLIVSWLILRYSGLLLKFISIQGARILSRVMGILLSAIAIEFIVKGIFGYLR
jgi:multiple antibiotic resistance protein